MNTNTINPTSTETSKQALNPTIEKFANEFANGFAEGFEKTIKREQLKQDILFYGKIALGVAAIAGIGLVVYRNWDNTDIQVIDANDL